VWHCRKLLRHAMSELAENAAVGSEVKKYPCTDTHIRTRDNGDAAYISHLDGRPPKKKIETIASH